MSLMKAWIYIENGLFFEAKAFGKSGTKVGEIVFNTSMTGYQEIVTDPSYAGQFIVFTMPEIGIVGTNPDDMESQKIHASGMIVRKVNTKPSNFRSKMDLPQFLSQSDALGICDIDTRVLTKVIRDNGPMMMIASTEISDKKALQKKLESSPRIEQVDYIQKVTTPKAYIHEWAAWDDVKLSYKKASKSLGKKIVAYDFGVKRNILNELCETGLEVEVVPASTPAKDLVKRFKDNEIAGVFLSNGPGDPLILKDIVKEIQVLIDAKVPMFGICLGHQLLSIAHGYPTYKLKFGQHGGNHPVKNMATNIVEITAQNHNYNVPTEVCKVATPTHYNLFDDTIEGLEYHDSPIFSVQHHPEASPGPHESKYIFKSFASRI